MALRDIIGLKTRKARPVGKKLERGRETGRQARRRNVATKVGIFLVLVVLTLLAFPQDDVFEYTIQVGDEWRRETLEAPFDFPIYKTEEEIAAERDRVRETTPPYFREVPNVRDRITANRDTVTAKLEEIFQAYESYLFNRSRGRLEEAAQDSARYMELRRNARVKLTPEQWRLLAEDYVARIPGLTSSTREPISGARLDQQLMNDAWEFSMQLVNIGVMDVPHDSIRTDEIVIRNDRDRTERALPKNNVYGLNEVYSAVQDHFGRHYDNEDYVNVISALVRAIFVPSLEYQRGETEHELQEKQSQISPTRGMVRRGEVIVRKGQPITDEIKQKLVSLERAQEERGGRTILWKRLLGQFLLTLATFAIFFLYLFMVRRPLFDDNRQVLLISLLFAGIIGLFAVFVRLPGVPLYVVPVAIVSVLLTVIFDSRVGLFGTLVLSLLGGLLLGYDFEFTLATLFGGTLAVFSVRDIKNRGQFFLSAGLVFVGYLVVIVATWLFLGRPTGLIGSDLLWVGINSFLIIMAYPLLWIFERAFDVTTDLTLLELSDTNRPLLKELSLRAPGTFNHSLQVANLAEAAADAIGANALLARVGALYHDIGKMLKPEYFVENQRPGFNPHDQLKPRMSALIIASHVKEGLEMGRQYNLPKRVLDFIPMHHGTTRIEYFYRKALDEVEEGDPQILESEFRYPGPRPNSKETGILMLADSVEAASRSLTDPTHKRLESLIDMIIKARIDDGQLDDTELNFHDLKQIKETFLSILLGIYHIRVKYPGQPKEEDRKPTREVPAAESSTTAGAVSTDAKRLKDVRDEGLLGIPEQSVPRPGTEVPDEEPVGDDRPVTDEAETAETSSVPSEAEPEGAASPEEEDHASVSGNGAPAPEEASEEKPRGDAP